MISLLIIRATSGSFLYERDGAESQLLATS